MRRVDQTAIGFAALLFFFVIFAIGCTREGAATGDDRRETPVVLFLGDSLTDGYTLGTRRAYPAFIERKISAAGLPFAVVNAGRSGDTAQEALQRLPQYLDRPVAVFMVALGANDAFQGLPIEHSEGALRSILASVKERHPRVRLVVAGVEPLSEMPHDFEQEFAAMFARVAGDFSASFIPSLLAGVTGTAELNLSDGIHPNERGNETIAATVWSSLEPLLRLEKRARM